MHHAVSDDRLWFQGNPVAIASECIPWGIYSAGFDGREATFFRPSFAGLGPLCVG